MAFHDAEFHRALEDAFPVGPPTQTGQDDEPATLGHAVIGWSVSLALGAGFWIALVALLRNW